MGSPYLVIVSDMHRAQGTALSEEGSGTETLELEGIIQPCQCPIAMGACHRELISGSRVEQCPACLSLYLSIPWTAVQNSSCASPSYSTYNQPAMDSRPRTAVDRTEETMNIVELGKLWDISSAAVECVYAGEIRNWFCGRI